MKEKELRLALVCYGGISLAVYMHGITKEIWKVLRASRALHAHGRAAPPPRDFAQANIYTDPVDTEAVYFDLLREIGGTVSLRVIVDIIAGASAGGINGVTLGHAIAGDLSLEPLRDMWLDNADVDELIDPAARSSPWSKLYMKPLLWAWGWLHPELREQGRAGAPPDREVRRKISQFVRARWFRPPFSGEGFARMLYQALDSMRPASRSGVPTLLPTSCPLDLFMTVTDYYGYLQRIRLNSPMEVREREHRLVISFRDDGRATDCRRSVGSIASLAFAARATASFPGAFPPTTFDEMDAAVRLCAGEWPDRDAFIRRLNAERGPDTDSVEQSAFIDGSVLNNKPFGEAIDALRFRPASREVDRRIVYIEPFPLETDRKPAGRAPGFFSTIRASLSSIPRNQPIRDDLVSVEEFSYRVRRFKDVIRSMEADVWVAVEQSIGAAVTLDTLTPERLGEWRQRANASASAQAGITFGAYVELKLIDVLENVALLIGRLAAPERRRVGVDPQLRDRVLAWARERGILPSQRPPLGEPTSPDLPWVDFLKRFDVPFRERRLRFAIRRLNQLYADQAVDAAALDRIKRHLYQALALAQDKSDPVRFGQGVQKAARAAAAGEPGLCLDELGAALDLGDLDSRIDALIADCLAQTDGGAGPMVGVDPAGSGASGARSGASAPPRTDYRRTLLLTYLGYPFFDAATLPLLEGRDLDEFDAIKVDRISPDDANSLRSGGARATLKGIELNLFGAFFSRKWRENDYLWGRLHGAERMIDIILSAVAREVSMPPDRVLAYKQAAFRAILSGEAPHLYTAVAQIADLRRQIDRLG